MSSPGKNPKPAPNDEERVSSREREFHFTEADFKFLSKYAYERTGIVLAEHKRDMLYSRIARRLRHLNFTTFSEYCDYLNGPHGDGEIGDFVNAVTTNLTSFFREGHHFDHLRDQVIGPLLSSSPAQKRLRIWSAGCSSGAEPYTIAMVLQQKLKITPGWDAKILATDIDTNMLARGESGNYPGDYAEKIPGQYRSAFVTEKSDGTIQMDDSLRRLISFRQLNLLESWPMKGLFDVIFCRNVVIYFDKVTQKKLFNRYADMIKPNGWLYVGHSESLHNVCDRFALQGKTIYRRVR